MGEHAVPQGGKKKKKKKSLYITFKGFIWCHLPSNAD